MSRHTAPMTDTYLQALRRRNELRLNHSRLQLGERWLLHPANAVRRAGIIIDYAPPFYIQHAGRLPRPLSMMAGFERQASLREWRL